MLILEKLLLPPIHINLGLMKFGESLGKKYEVSCIRMVSFQISVMRRLNKEYLSACKLEKSC